MGMDQSRGLMQTVSSTFGPRVDGGVGMSGLRADIDPDLSQARLATAMRMRAEFTASGRTLTNVAQALGVDRVTVTSWCTGRRVPRVEHAQAWAHLMLLRVGRSAAEVEPPQWAAQNDPPPGI